MLSVRSLKANWLTPVSGIVPFIIIIKDFNMSGITRGESKSSSSREMKKADGFINLKIKSSDGTEYNVPVICAIHLDKDVDDVLAALLTKHGESLSFTGSIVDASVGSGKGKFSF